MRLIDQVKPEVLDALAESKIDYSSSYRSIIASLSSADRYKKNINYETEREIIKQYERI